MIVAALLGELEPFRYTDAEMAMLAKLAEVRVRADAGDRKAKRQIAKVERQVRTLERQAKRGNAKAARKLRVLDESGVLRSSQVFAME
jgi:hypothetical protein